MIQGLSKFNPFVDGINVKHFIMYFGDIYHGLLMQPHMARERNFILSINQLQEYRGLTNITISDYERLAWEFRDNEVVQGTLPGDLQLGVNANPIDTTRKGNHKWKRMFVFGAGASANCAFGDGLSKLESSHLRPPVGFELFDSNYKSLLKKYEGARASISDFEAKGRDIEACLERDWQELRSHYNPELAARHINIQFFMKELFMNVSEHTIDHHYQHNLYSLLATKLQQVARRQGETFAFVSFNYDTILDHFLSMAFGLRLTRMSDYIDYNNKTAVLFKPHGSCNWGWPFTNNALQHMSGHPSKWLLDNLITPATIFYDLLGNINDMIHEHSWGYEKSYGTKGLGRHTISKNKIEVIGNNNHANFYPALLLPHKDKDEFVMHYDHTNAMSWYMNEMEELYLIGWKGSEAAFNQMLLQQAHRLKKIVIVNPNEQEVKTNLQELIDKGIKVEWVPKFEQFVLNELDKLLVN